MAPIRFDSDSHLHSEARWEKALPRQWHPVGLGQKNVPLVLLSITPQVCLFDPERYRELEFAACPMEPKRETTRKILDYSL